jgi:hypothetical protein
MGTIPFTPGPVKVTVANSAIFNFHVHIMGPHFPAVEFKWAEGLIGLVGGISFGGYHGGKLNFFENIGKVKVEVEV